MKPVELKLVVNTVEMMQARELERTKGEIRRGRKEGSKRARREMALRMVTKTKIKTKTTMQIDVVGLGGGEVGRAEHASRCVVLRT